MRNAVVIYFGKEKKKNLILKILNMQPAVGKRLTNIGDVKESGLIRAKVITRSRLLFKMLNADMQIHIGVRNDGHTHWCHGGSG